MWFEDEVKDGMEDNSEDKKKAYPVEDKSKLTSCKNRIGNVAIDLSMTVYSSKVTRWSAQCTVTIGVDGITLDLTYSSYVHGQAITDCLN
jgi:hypothetical protein